MKKYKDNILTPEKYKEQKEAKKKRLVKLKEKMPLKKDIRNLKRVKRKKQ